MVSLVELKKKTTTLKKKLAHRKKTFRWTTHHVALDDDGHFVDEKPLLKSPRHKVKKTSWGAAKSKEIADFAVASAVIVNSLSEDTESTVSSGGLYRSARSPKEQRVEHPVIHKRDIYISQKPSNETGKDVESKKKAAATPLFQSDELKEPAILPSYSITGSMLYNNIENGSLKEGSRAAQKLKSPYKSNGLPSSALMGSTLYRTMHLDESMTANSSGKTKKKQPEKAAKHQNYIDARMSADSQDDEDAPYVTIGRTSSKESVESTVSSVTMYSSYQNDPLVRASNNLYDILRSNHFEAFEEETDSAVLYEA